jgi:hypothetical protein
MPMSALNQVPFYLLPMSTSATVTANLTPSFTNQPFGSAWPMTRYQPIYSGHSYQLPDDTLLYQSLRSTLPTMRLAMLLKLGRV